MVTADSKSRPVEAAKAVRRLIQEDGAVAIVGSVFSFPTIAASIESNAWQTPFLSPVVSSRGVDEVGPWVYVTKVPLTVEVSAIAGVARDNLKIERFAVLTPVRGVGRELGEFFADEVKRLGGDVVALEYYDGGATDFRDQLERIRETAPDAIFSPGSVEELLLMLPQIKFYDLQVQLFGLSNWNSEKLLRLSRDELEGALFPRESYHGTDKAVY